GGEVAEAVPARISVPDCFQGTSMSDTNLRGLRGGVLLALVCYSTRALGWGSHEHEEIGSEGYRAACAMLEREAKARGGNEAARAQRMRIACGQLDVSAKVYGQATSLGGDNFADPDAFFTAAGFGKVWSRVHHALLARINTSHFHPFASRDWRDHHMKALQMAEAAAGMSGMEMVAEWGRAFFESAF